MSVEDLALIAKNTKHVTGYNRPGSSGDPSPMTAYGVYQGVRAACEFLWKKNSLQNKRILVQGLGKVGWGCAELFLKEGAYVLGTELSDPLAQRAQNQLGLELVKSGKWEKVKADIFCPCAMGSVVHHKNIKHLKKHGIEIIAGGANNQLREEERDGALLDSERILYAPDYVINAGGLINIAVELESYELSKARAKTAEIFSTLTEIFTRAKQKGIPTSKVAHTMALERLSKA